MKKFVPPKEPGCPMWMVSFGDTVSLLVTFFVMLIAFSDTDKAKLMEVLGVLKGALGVHMVENIKGGDVSIAVMRRETGKAGVANVRGDNLSKEQFSGTMFDKRFSRLVVGNTDKSVMLMMLRNGLSLRISTAALFNGRTAEIIPGKEWMLDAIADIVVSLDNETMIVNVLPSLPGRDESSQANWSLAEDRSWAVREYLLKIGALTEKRCSLGVRILSGEDLNKDGEAMPSGHMEIICVGYYPSRTTLPQSLLMN